MKKIVLFFILLFACVASHYTLQPLYASDTIHESSEPLYTEPISKRDTIAYGDSIIVIHTVCAPICSSHARVYNKEWKEIGVLKAPFKSAFPEAYIEDGKLLWRDNDTFDYEPAP